MTAGARPRPGEQVTGLPPRVSGDFLSIPLPGAHYGAGDAVPTVSGPTYGLRPSGLIVPLEYTRPPAPLDSIATYLTSQEVFGITIPAAITTHHLSRLPLTQVLGFCADLLRALDTPGLSHTQVDDILLERMFTPVARRRIGALLADGRRLLLAPQVLLVLVKYAAQLSGDCVLPEVEPGYLAVAYLGTGDDLEQLGDAEDSPLSDDELVVGTGLPGRLEREIVAVHHFHRQTDPRHVLAKFIRCWTQLPAELADDPEVVDLPAEFHAAVGIRLDDFIAAGVTLYNITLARGPRLPRDLLQQLGYDGVTVDRILRLVTRTPADLRAWAQDQSSSPMWEFSHLERFPLVDFGDHLLVLRPDLVLRRFLGWLPVFDIEAGLGPGKEKQLDRIRGCVRHLGEVYACESLQAQARRHGLRLFAETELRAALSPGQGRKTCDATVDDGCRWAVFEVTASRLTRESVASTSAVRLDGDFTKLLKKVRQLDATITGLRVRESVLTGQTTFAQPGRRYFPVLVLTEGFPVNPVTLTMLRQRAEEAGLLLGDDVAEIEVVDGTELEILEGAGFGEITVLDALEAKSRAALFRANLRDFLLREHRLDATTPDRVRQLAQVAYDMALRDRRPPPATGAA